MAALAVELEPLDSETESEDTPQVPGTSRRGLGCLGLEILRSAVEDYRHGSGKHRASAEAFLFPATADCRSRFDLIVSICDVDRAWLRDALDKARVKWDRERLGKSDPNDKNMLPNSGEREEAA
jgi:hypothetical protein